MNILEVAQQYLAAGLSVIPVKADGSKSPLITGWRKYSNALPTSEEITQWFSGGALVGIGVVPGPASGNLVVLDFEHFGESAYFEWIQRLPDNLRAVVQALPTVATPSGGRHVWIRLSDPQPGAKLARYAAGKTKIEIRGEGHQVLAPGCPAECHATGKLYEWYIEAGIQEIDEDIWSDLLEYCCQCNEYQSPEQPRDQDRKGTPAGEDSPGNDFNRRGTWEETGLFADGWTWSKQCGDDRGFLTRPGKESGISASVGMVCSKNHGYPYFYAWTTSTDFAAETPFSRFAVYAKLKHKGDYSEAAKELARQGYGERLTQRKQVDLSGFTMKINTPGGAPVSPFSKPVENTTEEIESKPFKWMSELNAQADDTKWLWKGYIPRGGIVLFSALWKAGKSTILSHLLKSFDGSQSEFLGLEITPSRVLYITEEDESIWADRRDALMINDHVGLWARPFKVRPTMQEWRDFIKAITEQVEKHQFDLVVFDTLSKMWPTREENDAGQVEEALMPLWNISNAGTAVLLVHHMRKSDGTQFVGARGSGGLSAFVELLMEFRRASDDPKDCKRVITAQGRYSCTPVKLECALDHGKYIGLGDSDADDTVPDERKASDPIWKKDLMKCLEEAESEWKTCGELVNALAAKRQEKAQSASEVRDILNKWINGGELERKGEGKKGDPYLYRIPV